MNPSTYTLTLMLVVAISSAVTNGHMHGGNLHAKMAKCTITKETGDPYYPIEGVITFTQMQGENVSVHIDLTGFNETDAYSLHGFHIHSIGDTGARCKKAGGHYNPTNVYHGGPGDAVRHVGDLGHFSEMGGTSINKTFTDHMIQLDGPHTIINRAVVVHEKADDMGKYNNTGSKKTGNAGARLGCCVIKEIKLDSYTSDAPITYTNNLMLMAAMLFATLHLLL